MHSDVTSGPVGILTVMLKSSTATITCLFFVQNSKLPVRHVNSCPMFQPFVKTIMIVFPFFVFTIPDHIVSLLPNLAFKKYLKQCVVI